MRQLQGEEVHSWDPACPEATLGRCTVGSRIAVEEIGHCLVDMAFTVFCGGQEGRRLALERTGWRENGVDEMGQ